MGDAPEAASFGSLIHYLTIDSEQLQSDIATKKITPILDRLGDGFFASLNMNLIKCVLIELHDVEALANFELIEAAYNSKA